MFSQIKEEHYKEANCIVFVYDVSWHESFEDINERFRDVVKLIFNFIATCLFFNQFLINKI